MENMQNEEKLSTSQLIMVPKHETIVDPCFLHCMGWIKPKNHFTPLFLNGAKTWDIRRRIFYTNQA
jgi:hypothetical protein